MKIFSGIVADGLSQGSGDLHIPSHPLIMLAKSH